MSGRHYMGWLMITVQFFCFALGRNARYCDERVYVRLCECVCLSASIMSTRDVQIDQIFTACVLPVAVTRFSSRVVRYVIYMYFRFCG